MCRKITLFAFGAKWEVFLWRNDVAVSGLDLPPQPMSEPMANAPSPEVHFFKKWRLLLYCASRISASSQIFILSSGYKFI